MASRRPEGPGAGGSPPLDACLPWDEHNRRLVDHVRPEGWRNPSPAPRYDLVVVGGGTGGLVTAAIAGSLGARVALVERRLLGGDCLNSGCVPSKAVIGAARAWRAAADASREYGSPLAVGDWDFARVMERMRAVRADLAAHDSADRFTALGVDVFIGHGRFTGPKSLVVDDRELRFRRAVVATGTRPAIPDVPGLSETPFLTSETIFSLTARPARLAVVGGGPIGCELAQAFAAFGCRVTLLEQKERILSRDDPDASSILASAMRRDGVDLHCGATLESVSMRGQERVLTFSAEGERHEVVADQLLVATSRVANVDGLGLREAGIDHDDTGVRTDDRLRTTNPAVYAIGDVASDLRFTHLADAHARLVIRNALFFGRGSAKALVVPWCTYTTPEVAHTGISWRAVQERGEEIETITVPLENVDRARLEGGTEGFFRVHLRSGRDTILGATIVGEQAGEMISQITQAITAGIGLSKLGDTIFPYPTRAEGIRKAADLWRRQKLTPRASRTLALFFRLRR